MAEIVVKEENDGGAVSAKVGDSLTVELAENATTGFRWAPAEVDPGIIVLDKDELKLDGETAVGAGGTRVFRFQVKGPGSMHLQFKLTRTWDSDAPSKRFGIHVNVQ